MNKSMNSLTYVLKRITAVVGQPVTRCVHVSVPNQQLQLVVDGAIAKTYPVSTALNGTGNVENSGQTPLGVHVVAIESASRTSAGHCSRLSSAVSSQPIRLRHSAAVSERSV